MCNNFHMLQHSCSRQRGISLILVLFLLIVVSLLAVAMARLNRGGSDAVSLEIQSTRALLAAESGAQIAAMRIFPINGGALSACPFGNLNQGFTTAGLNGCSANIECRHVSTAGRTLFTVRSEGICGSGNDRARRQITIGLQNL